MLDFARKAEDQAKARGELAGKELKQSEASAADEKSKRHLPRRHGDKKDAYDRARELLARRDKDGVNSGKLGVDLSVQTNQLRNQTQMERAAVRNVYGRNCMEIGGVWIDEGFTAKTAAVVVKANSDAYFELLAQKPQLKKVFSLGNHLVWVTPSGTALVIDTTNGKEKMTDAEIAKLFAAKK